VIDNNAWSSIFSVSTFLDISYEFVHLAATTYNITVSSKLSVKALRPTAATISKGPKYSADNLDESPGANRFFQAASST
jgi:hypothetical protein